LAGSCSELLLPIIAKFGVLEQTHSVRLLSNFVSIGFFCRLLAAKKKQNFGVFWTSAFSGVVTWRQSEKAEHNAQLQAFSYQTVSK